MTTWPLALAVAALVALAYLVGLRRGERLGWRRGRADLEAIARTTAEQSNQEAREAYRQATGEAVDRLEAAARSDRERGRERLEAVAEPLRESLRQVRQLASDLDERRARDHGGLAQLAARLLEQVENVEKSALSLREALKGDRQARGRWGEVQLRTLVETVGLSRHLDFETQVDANGARPDLVLRLPGGGRLAVDAKTPMDDFLAAAEAASAERAAESLGRHAKRIRSHADELSKRGYPGQLGNGPPFTVMFLPMEALLAEAVRHDPDLLQFAGDRHVVLATPHTLMGLLWAVSTLWRTEEGSRNVEALREAALEVERRLGTFVAHFTELGSRLRKATEAYNRAVASSDSRLLPQLRKLRELSGGSPSTSADRLPEPVEVVPRTPERDVR